MFERRLSNSNTGPRWSQPRRSTPGESSRVWRSAGTPVAHAEAGQSPDCPVKQRARHGERIFADIQARIFPLARSRNSARSLLRGNGSDGTGLPRNARRLPSRLEQIDRQPVAGTTTKRRPALRCSSGSTRDETRASTRPGLRRRMTWWRPAQARGAIDRDARNSNPVRRPPHRRGVRRAPVRFSRGRADDRTSRPSCVP